MNDARYDQHEDTQIDADLQRFLDLRAADTGAMPGADETVRILERRLSTPTTSRLRRPWRPQWRLRSRDDTRDVAPGGDSDRRSKILIASTLAVAGALAIALIAGGALPGTVDQDPGGALQDADLIVAADGSGTHETLEAAVAAAGDGDTIAVRPGTYDVALEITSDISIIGDGEPEAVVLQRQDWGPIMALRDADVTLSGLTVSGPKAWLEVDGGSPVIDGVLFDRLGDSDPGWSASLSVGSGSKASIRGSRFTESGRIDIIDSAATITGIEVRDSGPIYVAGRTPGAAIEDSVFTGTRGWNGALILEGYGAAVVEGNQFVDNAMGIKVENATSTIRDNTFRGNGEAIWVTALGDPNVEANTIEGNVVGIRVDAHRAPSIVGNRICDNETDLEFAEPNAITLSGNTICSQ